MNEVDPVRRPGPAVLALITIRFLLELALWSSFTISSVRLIDGPLGWVTGFLLTAVVITIWALLISPRRPVRLPVAARVAIELALFVLAASLLAASGLVWAGAALITLELLDFGLLHGPDRHAL
jgi:hypothetical protein